MSGHWEGNTGSDRYDVYPPGLYTVGDRWYRVMEHHDDPGYFQYVDGWVNGYAGYLWCGDWISPIACHWSTGVNHSYSTLYHVYEYRPLEWQIATGMVFNPSDPASGWIFRRAEWRSGLLWS